MLEVYLVYSLVPLFFILLGILVFLILKSSQAPTHAGEDTSGTAPKEEKTSSGD